MLFHQKLLSIQNFYYSLKRYLEKLPTWILRILIKKVSKVDFEIAYTHHLSWILSYLAKSLSREEVKALNNFTKQKIDKGDNIVNLSSKFRRVNIEEVKALNYLIKMEEQTICFLKSLEDQGEISVKETNY